MNATLRSSSRPAHPGSGTPSRPWPRSPTSIHRRHVRGVSQCTLDGRASFARAAGAVTTSPFRPRTCFIATGFRVTCPFFAAHPYRLANAASSRSHFDPPTRSGFPGANRRQCS